MRLASLLIGAMLVAVVAADFKDRPLERKFTDVDKGNHAVSFSLVRAKTGALSVFQFKFNTVPFPRFRTLYLRRDKDSAAGFKFRMGLLAVVEYAGDIDEPFNRSEIVSKQGLVHGLILSNQRWSNLVYEEVTQDDVTYKTATTTYSLPSPSTFKVTITLKIAPKWLQLNRNVTVAPNKVKFDLKIENYPYQQAGSRLGVLAVLQSKGARVQKEEDGTIEVEKGSGGFGWFRHVLSKKGASNPDWVKVKAAPLVPDDGIDTAGVADDDDKDGDETSSLQAFFFDDTTHPDVVEWDPDVAIDDSLDDSAAAALSSSFVALVAALVALVAARLA